MSEYFKETHIRYFKEMARIRCFEEALKEPIISGEIKTPCHLCIGQEAIPVGVSASLNQADHVYGNHRSHGHYLAKGGNMNALAAEIWGKASGCSSGKGGSMHIIDTEAGFMGSTPIVAGTVPIAVGDALAAKIKGDKRVVISYLGDGAMCEGVVYESINFATLHSLPIVFVCENNFYATHMPLEKNLSKSFTEYSSIGGRLGGWGLKLHVTNGQNVLVVESAARRLIEQCRKEMGPCFLEFETYRFAGHVGPDDNVLGDHKDIRPVDEVAAWLSADPLDILRRCMIEKFTNKDHIRIVEDLLVEVRRSAEEEVENAVYEAREAKWPEPGECWTDVYGG
jgi:acetoin:2,6-dichlorophenolindophenol oxidoreductase subunit alpha